MAYRLRQHLRDSILASHCSSGLTLLELLVVISVIGILAAIALPFFLQQANKAKEVEAIQNIKHLNERQKEFYVEKSQFTESLEKLGITLGNTQSSPCVLGGLGVASQQSQNYCYGIKTVATNNGSMVFHMALSKQSGLASLVGVMHENAEMTNCPPIKIPSCSTSSLSGCMELLSKAQANPASICSDS